ncbi:MAG: branched-chain amino acid aminotransferase [Gemmatimonadetes bacterium]|jgi:branched-chain amino acid aminotransferase|nr:branched-chain amino acid aminotransferase [Gemmatimonadota bacterium]MBT7864377.1 branched-chain amino acid aminotransferase [Gemmatimonadota bacterium]
MPDEPMVYLRGEFVPASAAHIAIFDAAVVLGATVTDLIRTFDGKPFRLADHLARFQRSCKYARIDPPDDMAAMTAACEHLIEHNLALEPAGTELAVVLFISPGELSVYAGAAGGGANQVPTFCIHTFPLPFHLWSHYYDGGGHVVTPSVRQIPSVCVDPKIKCRSRMHWWLADGETHQVDPLAVSLCLDLNGNVTETSGSNFLIVRDGTVVSPSSNHILPGISIQTVRELCADLGIDFAERDLQVYDVINADEAMLASTPYCLAPITKINGVSIGNGRRGPVFERLMAAWSQRVGLDVLAQLTGSEQN